MKTPTLVSAGALCAALFLHPPATEGQSLQLTWVDRAGKVIETVGPDGAYRGPDLAPDGKRLAVHRHDEITSPGRPGGGDVVLFDSRPGPGTRLTAGNSEGVEHAMPIWSPDGIWIVFGSTRNGKGGLYMKRADGSGAEELLIESETSKVPMSWSPDGGYVVYWSPGDIQWILPLTGNRKPFQLSPAATSHAQVSPDGKWIAYQVAAGRSEIVVKSFPRGSTEIKISRNGGVFPRWRGDGKELFFLSTASNGQMMAADITVKGSRLAAGVPSPIFDSGYVNLGHPGGNYHVFAVSRDGQRFLIPHPTDDPNARTLTVFDRQGHTTGTVGERGLYNNVSFSPDRTRVALLRNDPAKGTVDVWVLDVATGKGTPVTSSTRNENPGAPVWSPDGRQLAYIVARNGVEAIYRKPSNGDGSEELVYKFSGARLVLQEWTSNGRYLTYYSPQLGGNVVFALPLSGEQKPVEVVRSQFPIQHARLSPDNRFVAFRSNESGKDQIWVSAFDPSAPSRDKRQVSPDGGTGPVYWREDGKELYYLSLDRGMMAVTVRADSPFEFDPPRLLFKVPEAFQAGAGLGGVASMSRDGERFVFAVPRTPSPPLPPPPPPAIVILNRQGQSIQTVGQPGRYLDVTLSPDGARVLALKATDQANNRELWSLEVGTGKGVLVTSGQISSPIWSPGGRHIFYVTDRPGGIRAIMRKAADGSGIDETVHEHSPGAPVNINDITPDGRFLTFDSGGVILMLPLAQGDAASREPIEFLREEYFASGGLFSPDGRTIAYLSNETDRGEVYVQPFDPVSGKPVGQKRQMTTDGASDVRSWSTNGKELQYVKGDLNEELMMEVKVSTTRVPAGTPKFLFRAAGGHSVDGQSFAVVMPR